MSTSAPAPSPALTFTAPDPKALHHVLGHPLPSLIYLDATWGSLADGWAAHPQTEGAEPAPIDIFLLAIQKPVLVFLLPSVEAIEAVGEEAAKAEAQRNFRSFLRAVHDELPRLREAERSHTGEELEVLALVSGEVDPLREVAREEGIQFPILADPSLRFAAGLELPTFSITSPTIPPSSASAPSPAPLQPQPQLQRLTLLLRQGQVVRLDSALPHFPLSAGERSGVAAEGQGQGEGEGAARELVRNAMGLLKSDEELLREHAERAGGSGQEGS